MGAWHLAGASPLSTLRGRSDATPNMNIASEKHEMLEELLVVLGYVSLLVCDHLLCRSVKMVDRPSHKGWSHSKWP